MAATKHSDSRYQQFLEQLDIAYSLRAHCVSDGGSGDGASASKSDSQLQCWLDATRGAQAQPFGAQEQALVQALLPHLANALGSYAHMQRLAAETTLYREMIEHMALGCVLLNQQARVLAHNRVAAEVMAASPAICVRAQRLQLSNPEQQAALNGAVAAALSRAQTSNPVEQNLTPKEQAPANTALIRLGDDAGQPLSLAVHPMHVSPYAQGDSLPYVAVYLLDVNNPAPALSANREHSRQQLMKLLGLTEREATLALYLAGGDSIASAASQMHIAVATARNYSKNIYAKLGVASQSDLVRLVLASISALK
jgi:DNA-binding CsgD family transcriptional regulator